MKIICEENCADGKKKIKGKGWTVVTSTLLLFMPKCALCWAAYMSLFSSIGLTIRYQPWLVPVVTVLFLLSLIKLLIRSIQRKNYIAFVLAVVAGMLILSQRTIVTTGIDTTKIFTIVLMVAAIGMDTFLDLYKQLMKRAAG